MKTLYGLFFFVYLTSAVIGSDDIRSDVSANTSRKAFECAYCNSRKQKLPDDKYDTNEHIYWDPECATNPKKFLVNCYEVYPDAEMRNLTFYGCLKIDLNIDIGDAESFGLADSSRVIRTCSYAKQEDHCGYKYGVKVRATYCYCSQPACNQSTKPRSQIGMLVLLSSLSILFYFHSF